MSAGSTRCRPTAGRATTQTPSGVGSSCGRKAVWSWRISRPAALIRRVDLRDREDDGDGAPTADLAVAIDEQAHDMVASLRDGLRPWRREAGMDSLQLGNRLVAAGASAPLGATVRPGGVNFSVFSKHATLIELLLFDDGNAPHPARVIPLHADKHHTYHYWHVFVPGLQPGQVYAYRAHGAFAPKRGCRFDGGRVLLAPYGLAVAVPDKYDRWAAARPGDNAAVAMKSVVADPDRYDWEGERPLRRPTAETVIYELHVGGFTRHPSSGVAPSRRGTYAGLIEKIPYLKDLGVTAVQLLPVFQFDAQDAPPG